MSQDQLIFAITKEYAFVEENSPNEHDFYSMADLSTFTRSETERSEIPEIQTNTNNIAVAEQTYGGRQATDRPAQLTSRPSLARHTLGIIFLLITVVLWTTSNFLASVGQIVQTSHSL